MEITIHDKRKIHEIQKEFSLIFPNLRLDFFTPMEEEKHLLVHHTKCIGECRALHSKGTLSIFPHMTVKELKQGLKETFGLHVEVYRKVGNDWLETTSDQWQLEKHNAEVHEQNSENTLERI
jgi:hypothetical protein